MTPAVPHADDYRRLSAVERRIVRHVEATCRATGRSEIDAIALDRLERAARKERSLGLLGRWLRRSRLSAQDRVERLRSTLRHPSRTGAQVPARCRPPRAGTS
jgi:hypothetical protein